MLLRQMKYFVAVVDCNSFTLAAEQCYISQSAISQQIRALEKELGVELIRRENRRFFLTEAGRYFYSHCKTILEQAEDLQRETIRLGSQGQRPLRIGYLRNYSGTQLYQAVETFSSLYPEVTINIVNGTHEELYDYLRFKNVDLILSDQRRAFSDAYMNLVLRRCGCYAEISDKNPLSRKEAVQVQDLKHLTCILVSSPKQQDVERDYYRNTLGLGNSYLFAESLEQARLLVLNNRGFLPVEDAGNLPDLKTSICRIPILQGKDPLIRTYCAFWLKSETNFYIEEFAETLRKLMAGH